MISIYNYLQLFFHWVIETSLVCSVLVGLILLIKIIIQVKLPARWHYILWLTLLFRLMLPPLPEGWYNKHNVLHTNHLTATFIQPIPNHQEFINSLASSQVVAHEVSIQKREPVTHSFSFDQIALFVWLLGAIFIGLLTVIANTRVYLYVKRQPLVLDSKVNDILEYCKKKMTVKTCIPIVVSGKLSSPTVLGFIRPRILLSQTQIEILTDHQLKFIFYHELAHMKRKDVVVNCVMNGLLILHWFNPIIWFAYSRMRQDQEIGCDALSLSYVDAGQQVEYGHTIIQLLDVFAKQHSISSVANMAGGKRAIKGRILMIKKFQKKSYRWSVLGAASVIALSAFSFAYVSKFSNNKQDWKMEAATSTKQVATQQVPKVTQAELDKAAKNFSTIAKYEKGDDFFYYAMITMSLQKLEIQGEKDFIPKNTPPTMKRYQIDRANIQYLKNKAVETKASDVYQKILDRWSKGNFSEIQNDLLSVQNTRSTEGHLPTKVRTTEEEHKYIQHFFGDEGLQINKRDWQ